MRTLVFCRPLLLRFRRPRTTFAATLPSCLTCVLLSAVLLVPPTSQSQQLTQYAHTAWRLQDGVFDASPVSIAQTTDEFLWIGTLNGLMRFDGVRFESWNDRISELHTCCAFSLLGSSDGSLWIGTGGNLARLKGDKLSAVTKSDARYNSIIEDRKGRIWAARTRIRDGKGPLCEIEGTQLQCHGQHDGLGCQYGNVVAEDKSGTIWVGDEGKVCSWKDGAAVIYPAPAADTSCKPITVSILADVNHSMLIGCQGGLRRLERGIFVPFQAASLNADKLRGSKLLYDRNGSLWIGTENDGLYRVSNGVADHFGEADGLSDDNVSALYEDREGNIWVATANGIGRFHRLNVLSFSSKQGLRGPGDAAVLASRDGRTIWVSGPQGLTAMRNGKISMITRKEGLPGQQVTALFEDDRGVPWVGVDQDIFSYSNGHFTRTVRSDGQPTGMVVGMAGDANRRIWIVTAGTDHALLRLDPKTGVAQIVPRSQAPSRVASSPHGIVYLLSFRSGEISILHNADTFDDVSLPTGPRTGQNLLAYDEESLFVATTAGLYRWKDKKWSALTTKNGLPCENVQDLMNEEDGGLWLHLTCGFVQISKRDLEAWSGDPSIRLNLKLYDALDGARAGRSNFSPTHDRTSSGQLWFADGSVLQMIDPHNLPHNELLPPIHVERITADRKTYDATNGLRLPPRVRDLAIDYTALSLVAPEKVHFRYKLEGQDMDWREVVNDRQVQYSNLAPKHYRFRVIASNSNGVWNETGDTLEFVIPPAWYQTNWFRALCVAAFLALLWAAYQLRLRQLRHQFEMTLDARVSERTRIARDLHDTLLQSFQGLLPLFQAAIYKLPEGAADSRKILESTVDQAAQAISEGRDAVQGLRMSTVEKNDLAAAIRTVGEELAGANGQTSTAFEVVVEGTPRTLHPILRDEIYRVAAEALRNAFRHAAVQRVEVEVHYDEKNFRLRIRDDGQGIRAEFLRAEGREGHYGLTGMRERAQLVGGKLTIWTEVDSGTEIELVIAGARAYERSMPRFWPFGERLATDTDVKETIERE